MIKDSFSAKILYLKPWKLGNLKTKLVKLGSQFPNFQISKYSSIVISSFRHNVISMIHNTYLLSIFIATVFGWASWAVVINKLSPFTSPQLALSLFYSSLFVALTGSLTLIIYYLRAWFNKGEIYNAHLNISLRQGVLLSAMICIAIGFQRLKVLTWWDGLLLLAIVLLIEFYFMARD